MVREAYDNFKDAEVELDPILRQTAGYPFYNTSEYSLSTLGSTKTRRNLEDYISLFLIMPEQYLKSLNSVTR